MIFTWLLRAVVATTQSSSAGDTTDPALLTRVAFGSCSKQYKAQSIWSSVLALQPELWIWGGDAVYPKRSADYASTSVEALAAAYAVANASGAYTHMVSSLTASPPIVGTYDDHDYGVNDAGSELVDREQRAALFLDFIGVGAADLRRARRGVYGSHTFGPPGRVVKVIALDTRYHRALHAIPSVGARCATSIVGKVMPVLAAASRALSAWLGWSRDHVGTMLGKAQWAWVERELESSTASVHIVISSVQVFTTNPLVESWGHFPHERRRLLALLRTHQPRGLVILSGDVHVAELSVARESGNEQTINDVVVEVTSSGLTHTCTSGGIPGFVCRSVWERFAAHRLEEGGAAPSPSSAAAAAATQHFIGLNFGAIEIDWSDFPSKGTPAFNVTIHDVEGRAMLHARRASRDAAMLPLSALLPSDVLPLDARLGWRPVVAALLLTALVGWLGAAWLRRPQETPSKQQPPTVPTVVPKGEPPLRYFSHDFEWEDCASERRARCEGDAAPPIAPATAASPLPPAAATWDTFYARHRAAFYPPKRYLRAAFPAIGERCADCARRGETALLVEVGCGSGAAVLPLLRTEPALRAVAVDVSSTAVELLRKVVDAEDERNGDAVHHSLTSRLDVSRVDVRTEVLPVADNSADFVLMVFTLSAVEPEQHAAALAEAWRVLRPGGALLFRDFGLYDVKQVKCERRLAPRHYLVQGTGVQCYFFSTEAIAALCEAAGFVTEEAMYCTVRNVNRKTKKHVDRVWLHGVFRKP